MAEGVGAGGTAALHGVGEGAKEAAFELMDVLFMWIIPIVTLIVGYLTSASIGLSGAIGTLIDGVLGNLNVSATTMAYIAGLIAVCIWGAIAGAMWHVSRSFDGKYAGYILRPLATFFGGLALGEIPALAAGKVNNGTLGKFATEAPLMG